MNVLTMPDDFPWESVVTPPSGGAARVLKDNIVQCVLTKLGAGATHTPENGMDSFKARAPSQMEQEVEEGEIPPTKKVLVMFPPMFTKPAIISEDSDLSQRVLLSLQECASPPTAGRRRKTRKSKKSKKSTRRR